MSKENEEKMQKLFESTTEILLNNYGNSIKDIKWKFIDYKTYKEFNHKIDPYAIITFAGKQTEDFYMFNFTTLNNHSKFVDFIKRIDEKEDGDYDEEE